MKVLAINTKIFLLIAVLISTAMLPLLCLAHGGESITNGYICSPKNPGGEATRLYFRQQDGVAINLSQSETFPVVCPVIIPYLEPPYVAGAAFKNGSNATRSFNCALEEYDILSNLVRSTGRAVTIPAGSSDFIAYEGIFTLSDTNYLSLRCIIPPRGMVGVVTFW